jgi:hypothetical protein
VRWCMIGTHAYSSSAIFLWQYEASPFMQFDVAGAVGVLWV